MKKTKLLTSLAALALVLSLGACTEPTEEDVSSEDNEPTTSETTTEDNTSGDKGGEEDQYEDNTITTMISAIEQNCNYNATTYYLLEQSNVVSNTQAGRESAEVGIVQAFATDIYATQDAIEIDYLEYLTTEDGVDEDGWYYIDFEFYVNDYETNEMIIYYYFSYGGYAFFYEDSREPGTWQDNIWSLADLVEYKSAFTVEDSYYGIEEYAVDEDALDTLLNATIGNNYVWDSIFGSDYGGWNYYFRYADAEDIFSHVTADTYGLLSDGEPCIEVAFSDGGGWYYYDYNEDKTDYAKDENGNYLVLYQEVEAYTDIFLDTLGEIDIASMWEEE